MARKNQSLLLLEVLYYVHLVDTNCGTRVNVIKSREVSHFRGCNVHKLGVWDSKLHVNVSGLSEVPYPHFSSVS